jgi:hypothetical protein
MSIRFAAAKRPCRNRMAPRRVRLTTRLAANDNSMRQIRSDALHAALRHYAQHGPAAARVAGEKAQAALIAGDVAGHSWWLDICRTLDRRTAARVASLAANRR